MDYDIMLLKILNSYKEIIFIVIIKKLFLYLGVLQSRGICMHHQQQNKYYHQSN